MRRCCDWRVGVVGATVSAGTDGECREQCQETVSRVGQARIRALPVGGEGGKFRLLVSVCVSRRRRIRKKLKGIRMMKKLLCKLVEK